MKEIQIVSKFGENEILAQMLNGKIAMITDDNRSKDEGRDEDYFSSDNDVYIFALYKVLKAVDEKGGFNHLKKDEETNDLDIEKIYI